MRRPTFLLALAAASCGAPRPISRIEDKARLDVPVAICRKALSGAEAADAGAIDPAVVWATVYPGFRGFGSALAPADEDCTGETHAVTSSLRGSPAALKPADAVMAAAPNGDEVVWLRAFRVDARVAVGPLTLVRPRAAEFDVLALGTYGGSSEHSSFELASIGASRVIVAHDDGCADVKVDTECASDLRIFVVRGGRIALAGETPAARTRFAMLRGVGRVEYRLSIDPLVFDKDALRVHERLQVRDAAAEAIRNAEGDRVLSLGSDAQLTSAQESLWKQVPSGS